MKPRLVFVLALALFASACAGVLGFKPRRDGLPFPHAAHVDKGINCVTCHRGVSSSGQGGGMHIPTDADCVSCHKKPHDDRPCGGCHGEERVKGGVALVQSRLRFEHARHMKETKGDCVTCHREIVEPDSDVILPKMAQCFGCHEHSDQWTLRDCDGCHVDLPAERWTPESHVVHDGDWIREHGVRAASARDLCSSCHSDRSCAKCHGVGTVPALPARLEFDDVRGSELHRAGFMSRHSEEARANPGVCTTCHSEGSCKSCHAEKGLVPGTTVRSPHPRDWMSPAGGEHGRAARVDPASCASCHGGAGEELCVSCHRVGGPGGSPHPPNFKSTKKKTHDLPCRLCHGGA